MKRSAKLISIILIILIGIIGVGYYLISYNTYTNIPKSTSPMELAKRVKIAENKGGTINLDTKDINAIMQTIFNHEISKNNIKVDAVYSDISNDKLLLYSPIKIDGHNVTLTISGKLKCENNKLIYNDLSFKAGKLPLPKAIVMKQLKKISKDNVKISEDSIQMDSSSMPFEIKSVNIKNKKIPITIKKDKNSNTKKSKSNKNKLNSKRAKILSNTVAQLSSAASSCRSSKERAAIYAVQAEISKMIKNPSYRPHGGSAKSLYKKLTPQQRQHVKSAIYGNVNTSALMNVMETMH